MKYSALVIFIIFQGVVFTEEVDQSLNTVAVDDDVTIKDSNTTATDKGKKGSEKNETAVEEMAEIMNATLKEVMIEENMTALLGWEITQNDTEIDLDALNITTSGDKNTTTDDTGPNSLSLELEDEDENCTDSKEEELRGDMGHDLSGQEGERSNSSDSVTSAPLRQPFVCPYARRRQKLRGFPGRPRARFPGRPRASNNYFIFTLMRDRRSGVTLTVRCFGGHCSSFNGGNGYDARSQLKNPYTSIFRVAALRIL